MTAEIVPHFAPDQIQLIKDTVARGASDNELKLFLHACEKTGLDPLMKQIYAVKRYDSQLKRETMAVQTGIDGLRLVAERTGKYSPGREPCFVYEEAQVVPKSATAFIKKQTPDGTWHEVAATALYEEYVQLTREGNPTRFWAKMPHVMLGKVAEALALRRAFPMELSGIYSNEEMTQADIEQAADEKHPRLRGAKAQIDSPVVAVAEPAGEAAGEADRAGAGDASEPTGRAGGFDPERAKRQLESAIGKFAETWGFRPTKVRDDIKSAMLTIFQKEHFLDLTPEQYETVHGWLGSWARQYAAQQQVTP